MKDVDSKRYQDVQDKINREAVNVAAIVKVTRFDSVKMTVDVQPLSKHLENGEYQSQPPILSVPVASTQSGGLIIRPWIKTGDVGLVVYVDHDIDKIVANGEETEPNTERNHSTSDAVYMGGFVLGNAPITGLPDNAVVISTDDAKIWISVSQNGVQITGNMIIEDELQVNGNVNIKQNLTVGQNITAVGNLEVDGAAAIYGSASIGENIYIGKNAIIAGNSAIDGNLDVEQNLTANANVSITGNANIGGDISVTGKITAGSDVDIAGTLTLAGINMNNHTHGGVTRGYDNTNPPN